MASDRRRKRMDLHHVLHPPPPPPPDQHLPHQLSALRLDEIDPYPSPSEAEEVRVAVSALGSLRSASWAPPSTSPAPATSCTTADFEPSALTESSREEEAVRSTAQVPSLRSAPRDERELGGHPLVRGTLDAYARAKESSSLVKYSAGLVETIGRPVISRVGGVLGESNVQQLDGFARRQLDWLYPSTPTTDLPTELLTGPSGEELERALEPILSADERKQIEATVAEQRTSTWSHLPPHEQAQQERQVWLYVLHARRPDLAPPAAVTSTIPSGIATSEASFPTTSGMSLPPMYTPDPSGLRYRRSEPPASSSRSHSTLNATTTPHPRLDTQAQLAALSAHQEGVPRSGLSGLLVEAGVTAGGLTGAIAARPEGIKSLKYCLQWLQYATAHLEHHITSLRDVMVQINHGELDASTLALHAPLARNLVQVKGEVIDTLRNVVGVVSTYAGAALPSAARNTVKGFLLALPARWTSINQSTPPSSVHEQQSDAQDQEAQRTAMAAGKVFTLAVESLDILRNVMVVFGESLDRVDLWVDRLRAVGLQRKRTHEQQDAVMDENHPAIGAPPPAAAAAAATAEAAAATDNSRSTRGLSPSTSERSGTTTGSKRRRTRASLVSHPYATPLHQPHRHAYPSHSTRGRYTTPPVASTSLWDPSRQLHSPPPRSPHRPSYSRGSSSHHLPQLPPPNFGRDRWSQSFTAHSVPPAQLSPATIPMGQQQEYPPTERTPPPNPPY